MIAGDDDLQRVAFVTWTGRPDLTPDDQLAADSCRRRELRVDAVPWDDGAVAWDEFDAIVLRATWNYHLALPAFLEWLARFDAGDSRVWNPPALVRSNIDKQYLLELDRFGVPIPPTAHIGKGTSGRLQRILAERGWDAAVVKPTISLDGHETTLVTVETAADRQPDFERLLASGDLFVQQLLPEVQDAGELSVLFFDGAFSHAVRKRPRRGDFRVQERFGGTAEPASLDAETLSRCQSIVARIDPTPLYARVDGVVSSGLGFVLIELELIEPSLFLALDPGAADRFADAIVRRLDRRGAGL